MTPQERQTLKGLVDAEVRQRVKDDNNRCSECGAEYDCCTYGCRRCLDRRRNRKRPNRPRYKPRKTECKACGGPLNERTAGCGPCRERIKKRRKRERELQQLESWAA